MNPAVVVCWPVSCPGRIVTGSTQGPCSNCGAAVWVSPASRPLLEEREAAILCIPCFEQLNAGKVVRLRPPTPAQLAEIVQELLKEE